MGKYKTLWVRGSIKGRQLFANQKKCDCYVEHHFNAAQRESASYTCCLTGSNASQKSMDWAKTYVNNVADATGAKKYNNTGVVRGGFRGRGNYNLYYTACPAILLEPLFCTNPEHAKIIKSDKGQKMLAICLVESVISMWPDGAKIALSCGHLFKPRSRDRGATVYGGGYEGDYALKVLKKADVMFQNI